MALQASSVGDYSPTSSPLSTMRIFHALLGYLAVTALPFHLFAYPLAIIDYDGYVNTTQTHGDSPLMKRVLPGDTIDSEARQLGLPEFGAIFAVVAASVIAVAWLLADNPVRGRDVEFLVEHLIKSLLPGTCSVYSNYHQQDHIGVSKLELDYLPLPLFRRVRWS